MSPVSRGRKKKRPTTRPRNARVVPGLAGVHAELLGAFRPVLQATDPLEVEVLTSDLLGSWWKRLPPGEDPDAVFGEGAIGYAAQAGTREAMALLRALAVLGVTPAQRDTAPRGGGAGGGRRGRPAMGGHDRPGAGRRLLAAGGRVRRSGQLAVGVRLRTPRARLGGAGGLQPSRWLGQGPVRDP